MYKSSSWNISQKKITKRHHHPTEIKQSHKALILCHTQQLYTQERRSWRRLFRFRCLHGSIGAWKAPFIAPAFVKWSAWAENKNRDRERQHAWLIRLGRIWAFVYILSRWRCVFFWGGTYSQGSEWRRPQMDVLHGTLCFPLNFMSWFSLAFACTRRDRPRYHATWCISIKRKK